MLREKMGKRRVFVGVDGGGSKTRCIAIRENADNELGYEVIAEALAKGTNHNSVGEESAREELTKSFKEILKTVPENEVAGICCGMSGVDRPSDSKMVDEWISIVFPSTPRYIYSDAVIALAGGTKGVLEGIVVISGTGTIALGKSGSLPTQRCQGWGPLLGDVGSGYWIVNEAFTAFARSCDEMGPKTDLVEAFCKRLDLKSPNDIIGWVYTDAKWERFASLSDVVNDCALKGDKVAQEIYDRAAAGLFHSIDGVAVKLHYTQDKAFNIVFSGGMLIHDNSLLGNKLSEKIKAKYPNANIITKSISAEIAAALIAKNNVDSGN